MLKKRRMLKKKTKVKRNFKIRPKNGGKVRFFSKRVVKIGAFLQ